MIERQTRLSTAGTTLTREDSSHSREPVNEMKEPRPGDICHRCDLGILDYDGCLNLICSHCGFASGGGFT